MSELPLEREREIEGLTLLLSARLLSVACPFPFDKVFQRLPPNSGHNCVWNRSLNTMRDAR